MNNYEKIKSMSIDEMAEFIEKNYVDVMEIVLSNKEQIKQWLQKELRDE